MRRNINLELQLLPISDSDHYHHGRHLDQMILMEKGKEKESVDIESPQQKQQLTIFYNGKVFVCDVTEFQARAIIMLSSREMKEKLKSPTTLPSEIGSPTTALSMKRSIQRFLQKRNHRIQASSPYNHLP